MSALARTAQNNAHQIRNSGGFRKSLSHNRYVLRQFLESGRVTGSSGLALALRHFAKKIDEGNWEAIRLAIEYGCGSPRQVFEHEMRVSAPVDDFRFHDNDQIVERVEQSVSQITTRI